MVSETEYGAFLDLLYGAAVEPGDWERVIAQFADLIGGAQAWMPDLDTSTGAGRGVIARIEPATQTTYFQHFATRNPFVQRVAARWPLNVLTDEETFPKDAFVRTEFYNDFLKPQNIHSTVVVRLARTGNVLSTVNVGRPAQFGAAELDTARRLHPHLIRAFHLSRRFADLASFADGLVETLDRAQHGVLLLDATGRLRHANAVAQRLLAEGDGLKLTASRLTAWATAPARQIEALIGQAGGRDGTCRPGGSMALPTPTRSRPLSVIVAPLRSERLLATGAPAVLVCVSDLDAGVSPPMQQLGSLFGLTPAESRLALTLFEGAAPREAADMLGVSPHTVHAQLARIFEKTGTSRQAELIQLMMRTVTGRGVE